MSSEPHPEVLRHMNRRIRCFAEGPGGQVVGNWYLDTMNEDMRRGYIAGAKHVAIAAKRAGLVVDVTLFERGDG